MLKVQKILKYLRQSHRKKLLKRRRKKRAIVARNHFKFLSPTPLSAWDTIRSVIFHPASFFRSGIIGAYQKNVPAITNDYYAKLLAQPLHEYLWNYYQRKDRLHSVHWMGIPTLKMIFDLWIYQEILYTKKPDIIIEIGSYHGGSTLYLAHILELIGHGQIISIEIQPQNFQGQHPRVIQIEGDCSDPKILEQAKMLTNGKSVMVIHDGDHREFAALRDLELYAPLVSKGHYFIMEDGVYDLYNSKRGIIHSHQKGPLLAIQKFMRLHPNCFSVDMNSERFLLTSNPNGYLLKTGDL